MTRPPTHTPRPTPRDPADAARVAGAGAMEDLAGYLDSSRALVELALELAHTAGPAELRAVVDAAQWADLHWQRVAKRMGPAERDSEERIERKAWRDE